MSIFYFSLIMLGAVCAPFCSHDQDKSKLAAVHAQLESFAIALGTYQLDTGAYPTTEQGLEALRTRPPEASKWSGPYLQREIPVDPWGSEYVYRRPGRKGEAVELISYGQDRAPGGTGTGSDIVVTRSH